MSTKERPSSPPEELEAKKASVHNITPEALLENAQQDKVERRNIENLIAEHVESRLDWSQELRDYLSKYLRENDGQWRQCDAKDVVFNGFYPDYKRRWIEVVLESYGQEIVDDIPMPEWMKESK